MIMQASTYKINDREINVSLKKKKTTTDENNSWPRLTKASAKLPWLKVNTSIGEKRFFFIHSH